MQIRITICPEYADNFGWKFVTALANLDREAIEKILISEDRPPWRPIPSRQVAKLLGVSLQTLANWRLRECGPEWVANIRGRGNKLFYRPADIMSWLRGGEVAAWEISREWLKKKGLESEDPSREATEIMIASADPFV